MTENENDLISDSYACAARIVVCLHNGRKPGGESRWGFKLGDSREVDERKAQMGDVLGTPETRNRHLRDLRFHLQEDIAPELGTVLHELASYHAWTQNEGLARANELAADEYDGDTDGVALLVEKRIAVETREALYRDWAEAPFTLRWMDHIGTLYQIELLNGNSAEGRDLMLDEYNEAVRILIENWLLVQKLAIALQEASEGNLADDPVWVAAMKLFGKRF
jgi:hypothetical protein